jgi:hypothetical protein
MTLLVVTFDGDLLLASASVMIEPFRQHHDGTGSFVG